MVLMNTLSKFQLQLLVPQKGRCGGYNILVLSLFCSKCCGCRAQMIPPTRTIREDDSNELLIRRHIDIPAGSRYCRRHTVDDHLLREAFLSLPPYKLENRPVFRQNLMNMLQSYRERVNSKKYLDFDDYLCMADADYTKFTGFTRAQRTRILSYIPPTALKNTVMKLARSALPYLLMKLKLGSSNSVLASMVGITDKRRMSHIIFGARIALARHFVPHHLDLKHLTRQDVIDQHMSPIASRLLIESQLPCLLALNGTYLYIQVKYAVQRKTFNLQKKRPLIKFMVMVTTTGPRLKSTGRFLQENTGNQRNTGAVFPSENFRTFFPANSCSFRQKLVGSHPKNFRPEYCFHIPLISCVFLRKPAIFPAPSCRNMRCLVAGAIDLGYIVTIFGPFFSDFQNNDASILKHVMLNNHEDIFAWIKEGDTMIQDRGFRDSLGVLKALGIDAGMPSFLGKNQQRFNVCNANQSRFVTKLHWVVGNVNTRLKRFRWFSQTIQNSLLPSIPDFLAIMAVLNNGFDVSMVTPLPDDDNIVRRMSCFLTQCNALHRRLIQDNLMQSGVWKRIDIDNLAEPFPVPSLDYIRSLTLGNKVFFRNSLLAYFVLFQVFTS